jgi:hypothetical protein
MSVRRREDVRLDNGARSAFVCLFPVMLSGVWTIAKRIVVAESKHPYASTDGCGDVVLQVQAISLDRGRCRG